MSRQVEIRNPRISEVLQEMGFDKVGSVFKMRGHNNPHGYDCFGCDCCGKCGNCYRGRSYESVNHDILEIPDGVSRTTAKSFVNSAMREFG